MKTLPRKAALKTVLGQSFKPLHLDLKKFQISSTEFLWHFFLILPLAGVRIAFKCGRPTAYCLHLTMPRARAMSWEWKQLYAQVAQLEISWQLWPSWTGSEVWFFSAVVVTKMSCYTCLVLREGSCHVSCSFPMGSTEGERRSALQTYGSGGKFSSAPEKAQRSSCCSV